MFSPSVLPSPTSASASSISSSLLLLPARDGTLFKAAWHCRRHWDDNAVVHTQTRLDLFATPAIAAPIECKANFPKLAQYASFAWRFLFVCLNLTRTTVLLPGVLLTSCAAWFAERLVKNPAPLKLPTIVSGCSTIDISLTFAVIACTCVRMYACVVIYRVNKH